MALNNLDKINFRLPPDWKIPFYEFVGGKLILKDFEKELYKSSELEFIIGEDSYIELLSFDFSNNNILNNVVDFILENILVDEDEYRCKLFVLIGKFYMIDIISKTKKSTNLPEAVVTIFGGAHIDVKWKGINNPAGDIKFLPEVGHLYKPVSGCKNILPSSAVVIGYASCSDIEVLMDDNGIVYIYLSIIDKLYCGGEFFEALMRLFFGLNYGKVLCSAESQP